MKPLALVAAVCQEPENDSPQDVDIDIDFVLGACQNLLILDDELQVCRFAHPSVQEYLEDHCWSAEQANGIVAKVCLLLLQRSNYWKDGRWDTLRIMREHQGCEWSFHYGEHKLCLKSRELG